MDWIDFNISKPNNEQVIWGLQPCGQAILCSYNPINGENLGHIKDGNYYVKIVKWTTWEVIY